MGLLYLNRIQSYQRVMQSRTSTDHIRNVLLNQTIGQALVKRTAGCPSLMAKSMEHKDGFRMNEIGHMRLDGT